GEGGISKGGEIGNAVAAGESSVLIGSLFAGLDERPGEIILPRGRRFKPYRDMGSEGAMGSGSADRYSQGNVTNTKKYVPEGVEGRVPYRGSLSDFTYQMVGGLRAAMGYCGTVTIPDLRNQATFVRVSGASLIESHPHDIQIIKEAPNYQVASEPSAT
ncbi:MAG: IMP dehydrogenase, partial [Planctomycetes bacterium]|nr:IMP dehydrogenase [Planctomycetota bacterium]